jgi:hypothetical protein
MRRIYTLHAKCHDAVIRNDFGARNLPMPCNCFGAHVPAAFDLNPIATTTAAGQRARLPFLSFPFLADYAYTSGRHGKAAS